jgi:hypothetical protein
MRSRTTFSALYHPRRRLSNDLSEKDAARFWSKVDVREPDACWEWQAYRGDKGYGQFGIGRHLEKASRVAWALSHEGVFPKLCVLHQCDNPPCCNPAHLFLGTKALNNADMRAKGRGKHEHLRMVGEAHVRAVLTEEQVISIRQRFDAGERGSDLAAEYGVKHATISAICYGRLWKHVGGPVRVSVRRIRP